MTADNDNMASRVNAKVNAVVEQAKADVVRAAGERALERAAAQMGLGEEAKVEPRSWLPWIVGGLAVVFGGVLFIGLMMKVWKLALAAAFFGAIGITGYVLLAPRVRALRAQTLGKLEASRAEKQAADAVRMKQEKLEAELAALKKKV